MTSQKHLQRFLAHPLPPTPVLHRRLQGGSSSPGHTCLSGAHHPTSQRCLKDGNPESPCSASPGGPFTRAQASLRCGHWTEQGYVLPLRAGAGVLHGKRPGLRILGHQGRRPCSAIDGTGDLGQITSPCPGLAASSSKWGLSADSSQAPNLVEIIKGNDN